MDKEKQLLVFVTTRILRFLNEVLKAYFRFHFVCISGTDNRLQVGFRATCDRLSSFLCASIVCLVVLCCVFLSSINSIKQDSKSTEARDW